VAASLSELLAGLVDSWLSEINESVELVALDLDSANNS